MGRARSSMGILILVIPLHAQPHWPFSERLRKMICWVLLSAKARRWLKSFMHGLEIMRTSEIFGGRGLFQGIEFVADRATKEPFDPALKLNARIKKYAFEDGLICYPGGATADGVRGDHVLLAPPYIISDEQLDELVEKLGGAIDKTFTDIRG